jgi:hypothetical protein
MVTVELTIFSGVAPRITVGTALPKSPPAISNSLPPSTIVTAAIKGGAVATSFPCAIQSVCSDRISAEYKRAFMILPFALSSRL